MATRAYKLAFFSALLAFTAALASPSVVFNGSFEDDGTLDDDSGLTPWRWFNVAVDSNKFRWWVDDDWSGNGDYSLTLLSPLFVSLTTEDLAVVGQPVELADANEILFDVRLGTVGGEDWDPVKRSAVVMIDGQVIWDSASLGPDADGEYPGISVAIDQQFKDQPGPHILSLGLKSNVNELEFFSEYVVKWDLVRFDTLCGGFGYIPEDLNSDCRVDFRDYALLAVLWLEVGEGLGADLIADDVVDELDLERLVAAWLDCTDPEDGACAAAALLAGDLNDDGIVDYGDVEVLASLWLVQGAGLRADVYRDGTVDFMDFAVMAGQWGLTSWLFGL